MQQAKIDDPATIGARLRAVREALGYENQKDFADKAGISPTAYNNWEVGYKRIGVDMAARLCSTYRITLDWIYFGDASGLPGNVAAKLAGMQRQRGAS